MESRIKITVVGSGNNAQTMAADLTLAGCEVTLYNLPQFSKKLEPIMESCQLIKIGLGRVGTASLKKVTTDTHDAIRGAHVIIIGTPAFRHVAVYEAIADELDDNQIIVSMPGNWGALQLYNLLHKKGITAKVKIGETNRCMHISRAGENWFGPGIVRIVAERTSIQIAGMPATNTQAIYQVLKPLYPVLTPATNVLETSLNNSNITYHGPVVLMNTGWLEHTYGQFMIYRDGLTPSVGRCIDAICNERDRILKAFGVTPQPKMAAYQSHSKMAWIRDPCEVGPPTLKHRYLTEDIPYGLVPLAYLGDLVKVDTPLSDAMINLTSIVNQINYWKKGTTLETLELVGLTPKEILNVLNRGKR